MDILRRNKQMRFGNNSAKLGKEKCFVLTWSDDDINVTYRLRDTSQDAYDRLTSMLGLPTCRLEEYTYMIW